MKNRLIQAVENGDIESVKSILNDNSNTIDINKQDEFGDTALFKSLEKKHYEIAKLLIAHGADVNIADNFNYEAPLHLAAYFGNFEIIKMLLEHGADVNIKNDENTTALLYTFKQQHDDEIVKLLLSYGADPNIKNKSRIGYKCCQDEKGYTPFLEAVSYANLDIIKLLIEHGADIHAENNYGVNVLFMASCNKDIEVFKFFLDKGFDIHATDKYKRSILMFYLDESHIHNVDIIKFLLELGVDVNARSERGYTALMRAVDANCDVEIVRMLLYAGANVTHTDFLNQNALFFACENESVEIAKLLIDAGSNLNAREDDYAYSILHSCLSDKCGHEIVKLLVEAGANVNVTDWWKGSSPLLEAASYASMETVKLLICHGANIAFVSSSKESALSQAAYNKDIEVFKLFLDYNLATDIIDRNGNTILMKALTVYDDKNIDIVKLLLERKANRFNNNFDLNINAKNEYDETALIKAVERKCCIEIICMIIERGADVNIKNNIDQTPLSLAIRNKDTKVIELLQGYGAT